MNQVLIFLPTLDGGGAERVIIELSSAFSRLGLTVTLAVVSARGPLRSEIDPGVELVELGGRNVMLACLSLARLIRTSRPVAILSALSHANVVAALARRLSLTPCRLVCSEHSNLTETTANHGGLRLLLTREALRLALRDCDTVVTVSQGVASDLQRSLGLPAQRIRTIYNPVVSERLLVKSRAPVRHPWLTSREVPCLVAAGRLTLQKDFATLLRAIALLRPRRQVRLILLGEGELRGELSRQALDLGISDAVDFVGFIENPFPYMVGASAFVLSSRFEGLGNVLIEAMACGTAVVATDCPSGPSEILEGGRWGRLTPVGDAAALADAIEAAIDDPDPPDVRLRAAHFTVQRAAEEYLRLLLPDGSRGPSPRSA